MNRLLLTLLCLAATVAAQANTQFNGRWRLDPAVSTALDGWHKADLVVTVDGPKVAILHDMLWRTSRVQATNTFNTSAPVDLRDFFRIEQRHMAVYPAKNAVTRASASWIDQGRTLRTEVHTPVEVSQGDVMMRITSEYRLSETGDTLTVIELHSSRNRPLVYVFRKVTAQ